MAEVTVRWSERAVSDLEAIVSYISRDSEALGRNFARKVIDAVEVLANFPTLGRPVPEFNDPSLRELLYRNYRIVYQYVTKTVTIVAVFHGSRPLS